MTEDPIPSADTYPAKKQPEGRPTLSVAGPKRRRRGSSLLRRALAAAIRRAPLVTALSAVVTCVCLPLAASLETDNSPSAFFLEGSREAAKLATLESAFLGGSKSLRVVLSAANGSFPGNMAERVQLFRDALSKTEGVEQVLGPADFEISWSDIAAPGYADSNLGEAPPPLAASLGIVGRDGRASFLIGYSAPDEATERRLLSSVEDHVRTLSQGTLSAEVVGLASLNRALAHSTDEVRTLFFPAFALVSALVLLVALRSFRAALACMIVVALSLLSTLGLMQVAGIRLNLVLVILPTLLFAVALATVVHLVLRFFYYRRKSSATASSAASRMAVDKAPTILLMGLTSGAGFGSLATSQVEPIRLFGIWAAVGIAFITLYSLFLLPALLRALRVSAPASRSQSKAGVRAVHFSVKHRKAVATTCILLAGIAAAFITRIPKESSALHYLDEAHPVRRTVLSLEDLGFGSAAVEVLFEQPVDKAERGETPKKSEQVARDAELTLDALENTPAKTGPYFWKPAELDKLARFSSLLRQDAERESGDQTDAHRSKPSHNKQPPILGVLGAGDLMAEAMRRTAQDKAALAADFYREKDLRFRTFLSEDGRLARTTVLVPFGGEESLSQVRSHVHRAARKAGLPPPIITGEYAALLDTQGYLLDTLLIALLVTMGVIGLLFVILYRKPRIAFYALLPNLWPVLMLFGFMGAFRIPLDIGTAMVASIALGLAVDDTLHSLETIVARSGRKRLTLAPPNPQDPSRVNALAQAQNQADRVALAISASAPAYLLSATVLVLGFLTCTLSDFGPTMRFGLLAALAALLALVGDLFLLPVLFQRAFGRRQR